MPISAGTRFDRYQIISQIGTGGMGEIYLAQDTRLGRKVALKLLPAQYTQDAERLRRFEQEAFAASALNHPNIITIYEIGEAEGRHFIATEFIEGLTLRRRLVGTKTPINETLDIAVQVVSALAAAHTAGIVHRDIKPENIMIRPDGYVKVLDFGLAKLTEKAMLTGQFDAQIDSEAIEAQTSDDFEIDETAPQPIAALHEDSYATSPPNSANETTPGLVMGTAQYMSPEQARGLRVDSRTDIFSFGIVLYEMIAGRAPFSGANSRQIIHSILNDDPLPLSHFTPDAPEVIEWITAKALVKDREERYQSSKEMLNDLKRLQHRIEIEHEISRARRSDSGSLSSERDPSHYIGNTTEDLEADTGSVGPPRVTEFFEHQLETISRSKLKKSLVLTVAALLFIAAGYGVLQFIRSKTRVALPFQPMQVKRFTNSGKATRAAISPDGNYVVFVQSDLGKESLYVRQVNASNDIEIVGRADVTYRGLTFSHDGKFVYYVVQEQNNPIQSLYQVPMLGRVPRKILVDIDSPIALSPDSGKLAFVRRLRGSGEDALIIADANGTNERILASRKGPDFFGVSGPAWSPDGKIIACAAGSNTGGRHMYVAEINVAEGKVTPISSQKWSTVGRVSWIQEGGGLIIIAMEQGSTLSQVWYSPYPRGVPRRITNDLNDYRDMSLSSDSRSLVAVQSEAHVNVWLLPINDPARARQITDGVGQYNGVRGLRWMPDGRLAYISRTSGSQDIWIMDQNGGDKIQLTTPETRAETYPVVSPDGRFIVFVSNRTGNSNIYRLDLATRDQIQLTFGTSEEFPTISADGSFIIYTATGSTNFTLWKVSIDGGEPEQLTDRLSQWPDVSPDGQSIACWYRENPSSRWRIAIIPISGGSPVKTFEVPLTAQTPIPVRWTPDGNNISFVDTRDGISNIWSLPIDGGAPKKVTDFHTDQIFWFDWSRDGKQLACSRGRFTNDVVLISEFE